VAGVSGSVAVVEQKGGESSGSRERRVEAVVWREQRARQPSQQQRHEHALGRVQREEGRAEARRERRRRLVNAAFGAGDLGRVAGQEVVHGLAAGELGDGREDAEGVAREEDDVLRVAGHLAERKGRGEEA
jgi:hypothetical protein